MRCVYHVYGATDCCTQQFSSGSLKKVKTNGEALELSLDSNEWSGT